MLPVSGRTQPPHDRLIRRLVQTRFGHPRRPAPHALPQAHVAGAVQEGAHLLGVQAPQGFVAAAGNRHVLARVVLQDDVGAVGQQRARQAVFQGDLGDGLPVGPHGHRVLAVVPQEDVQHHVVVTRVGVMPVGRPAGGVAVDFHVAAAPLAVGKGDGGLLKIGAGVDVPASRGMHGEGLAVQGAQGGGTPAGVEPQAVQQFFRDQALPVERRFGHPTVVSAASRSQRAIRRVPRA